MRDFKEGDWLIHFQNSFAFSITSIEDNENKVNSVILTSLSDGYKKITSESVIEMAVNDKSYFLITSENEKALWALLHLDTLDNK